MISVIDVEIQAVNPSMPLYPWRAFINSPSSLRIRNVPKKIGTWQITSIDVQVEYPDNSIVKKAAKLVGGVWVATLNGSTTSGTSNNGYTVIANGIDENGNVISDYILGKGDVEILNSDSIIESGIKVNSVKIYDEIPTKPKDGDIWFNGDELVIFNEGETHRFNNFVPTASQQNALNSGITQTKVSNYDRVYNKVPVQTFENDNMLADKAFVNSSVQTATANFRGNWATFAAVPADVNEYPEDYQGVKTPTTNDYMVVENYNNNGTWRFKYVGNWDVDGKNGWRAEYQVNETPMTADQLAALNSGITQQAVQSISLAIPKYRFVNYNGEDNNIILSPFTYTIINAFDYPQFYIDTLNSDSNDVVREFGLVVLGNSNNITWPSNFHARTDDVFITELGINMFWISEYFPNEFVVSRQSIKDDRVWCLCFTAEEPNSTISMTKGVYAPEVSLYTSIDGRNWTAFIPNETIVTLANVGDKVYFKAGENGNENFCVANGTATAYANIFSMTGKIAASGNIMSLLNGDNPTTELQYKNTFAYLFYGCGSLTKAPELPATTLTDYCYHSMFYGCTSLTQSSELPATTLADYCYYMMFRDCSSLIESPELPSMTLANGCYRAMCQNCTSITEAPELPATLLTDECYQNMFNGCTSLTQAPELPATSLAYNCYYSMFRNCTSLKSIDVDFNSWDKNDATTNWVFGVASSGTFTCPTDLPEEFGTSRIPTDWTVIRK